MPEEIFFLLALILSLFGFAFITAHIYWTMKQWSTLSEDRKLGSFFLHPVDDARNNFVFVNTVGIYC